MLIIIRLFDILVLKKNKNNNKVFRFDVNDNNIELIKKSRKLEDQNLFKF